MSEAAGHDIRKLIAMINQRRPEVVARIIDPGTKVEQCDTCGAAGSAVSPGKASSANRRSQSLNLTASRDASLFRLSSVNV